MPGNNQRFQDCLKVCVDTEEKHILIPAQEVAEEKCKTNYPQDIEVRLANLKCVRDNTYQTCLQKAEEQAKTSTEKTTYKCTGEGAQRNCTQVSLLEWLKGICQSAFKSYQDGIDELQKKVDEKKEEERRIQEKKDQDRKKAEKRIEEYCKSKHDPKSYEYQKCKEEHLDNYDKAIAHIDEECQNKPSGPDNNFAHE